MDENTRRYYLQAMGIQSWQLLDAENFRSEELKSIVQPGVDNAGADREVVPASHQPKKMNWLQLETKIRQCAQCPLHKTRRQAIVGRGNQSAALMIVLLAPEMSDDASGLLCNGESYELLSKMLNAIDIVIDDVYLTSLLKCGLPAQHTVSPAELQQCGDYLKQQIRLVRPRQLVIMGENAVRCLLQNDKPLDDWRALINVTETDSRTEPGQYESVPLLVSYSPQELLQQPENKRKAWQDLQQLQKIMHSE